MACDGQDVESSHSFRPSDSLPVISGTVAADSYLLPFLDIALDWESFLPPPHLSWGHPTSVPGWCREIWFAFTNLMPLQRKAHSSFWALRVSWDWVELPSTRPSPCVLACSTALSSALGVSTGLSFNLLLCNCLCLFPGNTVWDHYCVRK